ncbi:hypothetical protein [Bacillus cereus group sp. BfR-BA-01489]|uniref:hypothetical protein n=1 Tax=Bacillus TaxID=1386 RepID=UPI001F59433E
MFKRKEIIPFRDFMNQSYKKQKQVRAFSLEPLSPMAFFHMSQPLVHTYVALGVLGGLTIGAVLLERYLIQNDYISAAKFVSEGLHHGIRIGGIGFVAYVFIRIVIMF